MKLYTEEQIFKYLLEHGTIDLDSFMLNISPIEPPSDEEIWDKADEELSGVRHYAFMRGANWMRNKIQGGEQ